MSTDMHGSPQACGVLAPSGLAFDKLPFDSVAQIFHQCYNDCLQSGELIPISQVSTHWREISLAIPSLWTKVPAMSPNETTMLLSRSADAPIYVHLHRGLRDAEHLDSSLSRLYSPMRTRLGTLFIDLTGRVINSISGNYLTMMGVVFNFVIPVFTHMKNTQLQHLHLGMELPFTYTLGALAPNVSHPSH
jgi:hypothetical protein